MAAAILALLTPPLLAAATPSDEQTRKDLRCHLVMTVLADESNEKGDRDLAYNADVVASYFLGKVVGRRPQIDLVKALKAEADTMGGRQIGDFAPACMDDRMRTLRLLVEGYEKSIAK